MTNILVLNVGTTGCDYFRVTLPIREMERHGHEVRWPDTSDVHQPVGPLNAQGAKPPSDEDLEWADIAVGRQLSYPGIGPHWDRWAAFTRLVYDTDDDLFQLDTTNPALTVFLHPGVDEALRHMLGSSSLVTVPTEYLARKMRRYTPNVAVLPNCIDESVLELNRDPRPSSGVVVGWAGSSSHVSDWMAHARPIRDWRIRHPQVDFHLVGVDYRPMLEIDARFTGWAPTEDYYRNIDFDIGLAPLAQNEFNRSKSPIKALEYAALGIPVVASAGTAYDEFVEHGVTGFLVEEASEWTYCLDLLVRDQDLREAMGEAARAKASEWTIQKRWHHWESAYGTA